MTEIRSARNSRAPSSNRKAEFYKFCRKWHGYLSAFAFAALFFFAVTGIMLNHPEWFADDAGDPQTATVDLPLALVTPALNLDDPATALAGIVENNARVIGRFASGEVADGSAFLRFEGVRGNTDVTVDLATGRAGLNLTRVSPSTIIQELHRGTSAGLAWRLALDVMGILIIALSVIGFVLFFSMRFRLRTSLTLVVASLAVMGGLFAVIVP